MLSRLFLNAIHVMSFFRNSHPMYLHWVTTCLRRPCHSHAGFRLPCVYVIHRDCGFISLSLALTDIAHLKTSTKQYVVIFSIFFQLFSKVTNSAVVCSCFIQHGACGCNYYNGTSGRINHNPRSCSYILFFYLLGFVFYIYFSFMLCGACSAVIFEISPLWDE